METIEIVKFIVEIILLVLFVGIAVMIFIISQKINALVSSLVEVRQSLQDRVQEVQDVRSSKDTAIGKFGFDAQLAGSLALRAIHLFITFLRNDRKTRK